MNMKRRGPLARHSPQAESQYPGVICLLWRCEPPAVSPEEVWREEAIIKTPACLLGYVGRRPNAAAIGLINRINNLTRHVQMMRLKLRTQRAV